LRAPWIMEKDDFKYTLSFGKDVFGGPRWRDLVGNELADKYQAKGTVPIMLDPKGKPVLRNFVHVDDLVEAILKALVHPKLSSSCFSLIGSGRGRFVSAKIRLDPKIMTREIVIK